jgi:type I restriction enzyme S subunit
MQLTVESGQLPAEWKTKKLGDVCKFQGGSQPPKSIFSTICKENYVRLIQIRDYKSDNHVVFIPKDKARRFCTKEDVMIGRYGPPVFQILRGLEGAYNDTLREH